MGTAKTVMQFDIQDQYTITQYILDDKIYI